MKTFKKVLKKIVLWSLTGLFSFLGLIFLVTGGILSALFATAFIVLIIPIDRWQLKVKKIIKGKLKVIIAIVLAILFFVAVPSTDLEDHEDNTPQTSITNSTEPSTNEVTEPITDPILETVTEPTTVSITEPATEPTTTKPQIEQTEPIIDAPTTPTTKPVVKPTEPTTKPTTEPVTEPSKPATEATKPTSNPSEPATEPTSKPSEPTTEPSKDNSQTTSKCDYVVNTNSKKFHYPDCSSVKKMSEENRWDYYGSREELIDDGYKPCGNCDP